MQNFFNGSNLTQFLEIRVVLQDNFTCFLLVLQTWSSKISKDSNFFKTEKNKNPIYWTNKTLSPTPPSWPLREIISVVSRERLFFCPIKLFCQLAHDFFQFKRQFRKSKKLEFIRKLSKYNNLKNLYLEKIHRSLCKWHHDNILLLIKIGRFIKRATSFNTFCLLLEEWSEMCKGDGHVVLGDVLCVRWET